MTLRHIAGSAGPDARSYDADIIILALDRIEETLAAIGSALAQTAVHSHIFILDQGSRPENLSRLQHAVQDKANVTLLATETNLGVGGGRNALSNLGHGRVIVGLDNDATFATADTVARLVGAMDETPRLAAIGCRILTQSGEADDLSSWGYPKSLLPSAGETFDTVTFVGAGHAIRRTAWEQAGGYDATLFFCWEEYDFCLRAIALGWWVRYRGDIAVHHAASGEHRVGWTAARWFYFVRNRLYIERKLDRRWPARMPRTCAYILKGVRNGMPLQTMRAIHAAHGMGSRAAGRRMSGAGLSYMVQNDRAHRGSLLRRLLTEVLVRPTAAAAE